MTALTTLALIGVVYTKDGRKVEINIGLKDSDPVFYISDLLIHMIQLLKGRTALLADLHGFFHSFTV